MTPREWRVLIIDDNPNMTSDAERELHDAFEGDENILLSVKTENDFTQGFTLVKSGACDLVVLDVRKDKTADTAEQRDTGRGVYTDIQEVRFLPIIFWTALPDEVSDKRMPPLVEVLSKDELDRIPEAIRSAINSGVAGVMASIEDRVATVMREYMWKELGPNWSEDTDGGNPDELAHILISRVAHDLQEQALPELTRRPSHCYLYPPVATKYRPGDLLRNDAAEDREWWVILTPACDLQQPGKADYALLGKASLLTSNARYQAWQLSPTKGTWNQLRDLLTSKIARYYYLPEFREIPDLLLDLEDTHTIPLADLGNYIRMASLVAPYSEALLTRYSHFRGRIGVPDLNVEAVYRRLTAPIS